MSLLEADYADLFDGRPDQLGARATDLDKAADAIARLKDQRVQACSSYFARSRAARKPRTNHDDVVHLRLLRQS